MGAAGRSPRQAVAAASRVAAKRRLGQQDLALHARRGGGMQVGMVEAVVGEQKAPIAGQLLGAGLVRHQPAAGGEEGRRHVLLARRIIDDGAVIAGDRAHGLAEVEGERDRLVAAGQIDPADDAGERARHRRRRGGGRAGLTMASAAVAWRRSASPGDGRQLRAASSRRRARRGRRATCRRRREARPGRRGGRSHRNQSTWMNPVPSQSPWRILYSKIRLQTRGLSL